MLAATGQQLHDSLNMDSMLDTAQCLKTTATTLQMTPKYIALPASLPSGLNKKTYAIHVVSLLVATGISKGFTLTHHSLASIGMRCEVYGDFIKVAEPITSFSSFN